MVPAWLVVLLFWRAAIAGPGCGAAESNAVPASTLNPSLLASRAVTPGTTLLATPGEEAPSSPADFEKRLAEASAAEAAKDWAAAEKIYIGLLKAGSPKEVRKTALLELAVLARTRKDLPQALQFYAQFLKEFFSEPEAPEILLRQGLLYREMGAPMMALSKFYAVMSSALNLKTGDLSYYKSLVLRAQCEIADTYCLQGKHAEGAEFLNRLLKLGNPELDLAQVRLKLVRSLSVQGRHTDTVVQGGLYLDQYPESDDSAEVRFLCADALRKLGRRREAMEMVLELLEMRRGPSEESWPTWIRWQQRTGNGLANQLYQEGDHLNALEIYRALASCSTASEWRLPALYQVGLVYERLRQVPKAIEAYDRILEESAALEPEKISPSLASVLSMAKWRKDFLGWQQRAEQASRQLSTAEPTPPAS